jgi:hypothetical protein
MQDDKYDEAHTLGESEKLAVDWPFPAYGRSIPYILGIDMEREGHLPNSIFFREETIKIAINSNRV